MDNTFFIITVVAVLLLVGVLLSLVFLRRRQTKLLQVQFGAEYDHTVQTLGNTKKAQTELINRQKHVDALDIRSLTDKERERYLADWTTVQSKFVDEPGQAVIEADRLIMEVLQLRAYPLANFEERAADISISYPALVSNYRAARVIAIKNEQSQAQTEELRQALIYYRSLFEELLEIQPVSV